MQDDRAHVIVLFDGVCNLCNRVVQFVIQHDGTDQFRFAAIQSEYVRGLVDQGWIVEGPDSVMVLEGGMLYQKSDAALRIARRLNRPWYLMWYARFVPKRWRDGMYDWIAKNRYHWFGRQMTCMVPTPELRKKFYT